MEIVVVLFAILLGLGLLGKFLKWAFCATAIVVIGVCIGWAGLYIHKRMTRTVDDYTTEELEEYIGEVLDQSEISEDDLYKMNEYLPALHGRLNPAHRGKYVLKAIARDDKRLVELFYRNRYCNLENVKILRAMLKYKFVTHDQALYICESKFSENKENLRLLNELLKWKRQNSKVTTLY